MLSHMLRAAAGLFKPPSFVGGATATSNNGGNFNVSLTALTGGLASAPSQDDLVIVVTAVGDDTACDVSGYTLIATVSTTISTLWIGRKFMGATPDTSLTVTGSGTNTQGAAAIAYVWRGVNTTTPMDVTTTTSSATNTGIPNPPSITPVTQGAVILAAGSVGYDSTSRTLSSSSLSNFFNATANLSGGNTDATAGVGWRSWTSGAYDPPAFTLSGSDSTLFMSCAATMALRPK